MSRAHLKDATAHAAWLTARGYSGLVSTGNECGCEVGDLYPCGERQAGCRPGYKVPCAEGCDHGIGFVEGAWHVQPRKPSA